MIEWTSEWRDSLMWCPSQCYRSFTINGRKHELYCRWRHDDPWTFAYYPTYPTMQGLHDYDPDYDGWIDLGSGLTQDDSMEAVHTAAETLLMEGFKEYAPKGEEPR